MRSANGRESARSRPTSAMSSAITASTSSSRVRKCWYAVVRLMPAACATAETVTLSGPRSPISARAAARILCRVCWKSARRARGGAGWAAGIGRG